MVLCKSCKARISLIRRKCALCGATNYYYYNIIPAIAADLIVIGILIILHYYEGFPPYKYQLLLGICSVLVITYAYEKIDLKEELDDKIRVEIISHGKALLEKKGEFSESELLSNIDPLPCSQIEFKKLLSEVAKELQWVCSDNSSYTVKTNMMP